MDLSSFLTPSAIVSILTIIFSAFIAIFTLRRFEKLGVKIDLLFIFAIWVLALFSALDFFWIFVPAAIYAVCSEWVEWFSWTTIMPWCALVGAIGLVILPIWIPFLLEKRLKSIKK